MTSPRNGGRNWGCGPQPQSSAGRRVRAGGKSQAEWDEFSQFVMKASEELGIEVASLDIEPVHNIITP